MVKNLKTNKIMKTLEELSHNTFYKMGDYSQLVIDLVEEVEDAITYDEGIDTLKSINYNIINVLEVININRIADIKALELLSKFINEMVENQPQLEFKNK
jgi:hypothetical protein